MMMFSPNYLVRQKEGAQGEGVEETGGRGRVQDRQELQRQVQTLPYVHWPTLSGVSDARNKRNMDGGVGY